MDWRTANPEGSNMENRVSKRKNFKVGILGAGAWGTAVGKVLADKGHNVEIWAYEKEVALSINREHHNSRYLMGVQLPELLKAVTDLAEAAGGKDYLLIAVPSAFILETVRQIAQFSSIMDDLLPIGVLSKGFVETDRGIRLIVDSIEDNLPERYKGSLVYISGPSHAEEVARGKITGLISASLNGTNAIRFRELLSSDRLLVFSSLDIKGVQISAAVKNVIAIAFGMLDALDEFSPFFGDNVESLLLAAGLNEIQKLGLAMGATHPETFTSIAGVGDLDVTCRSRYGRNRRFGREIVLDHLLDRFDTLEHLVENIASIGYFAEGVIAAGFAHRLADQYRLKMPICQGVYRVLNKESEPLAETERILRQLSAGA